MEATERSSSLDLSSVPGSDTETPPAGFGSFMNNGTPQTSASNPFMGSFHMSGPRQEPPPAKKPRKPRAPKPKADPDAPKPARKPRASNGATTNSRKKAKIENTEEHHTIPASTGLQSSRLVEPYTFPQSQNNPGPTSHSNEAAKTAQNGFSSSAAQMQNYQSPAPAPAPPSRPSTAMYDPIRGSIIMQEPSQPASSPQITHTPPRPVSRPGASPISSLIDPPVPAVPTAPSPLRLFTTPSEAQSTRTDAREEPRVAQITTTVMDVDGTNDTSTIRKTSIAKKASEPPTRSGSPKPAPRAKEQPPPLPTGKGLLSATVFGGELSLFDKSDPPATGPNIVLRIDLKDPNNKVINFARLAEEKYGFAALYPRQAAQKARLERVAAAGAALERSASGSKVNSAGESGDDDAASVDIDRDTDNDGDVAMGGTNGAAEMNSGTDAEPKKKIVRRKKAEEYDLEDDFVDDSEQIWEAQAATSKEGFFVYCGPLVPEGEKATIERADGTVKPARGGRGRGRGGGPGSRGGRGARAAAAARDSNVNSNAEERPKTGPGSRGGKVTGRRTRGAKASAAEDRQQVQQTKTEAAPALATVPEQPPQVQAAPVQV